MMKASIRNIVLGGVLAGLTAAISVAKAAEPAEPIDVHQAPGVVEEVRVTGRPSAQTAELEGPLSVYGALGGARGAQGPDPWMVSGTVGAAWTRNWLRIGLEVGWDHGIVRHPATETPVGVTV